jgi:hypothetical protein
MEQFLLRFTTILFAAGFSLGRASLTTDASLGAGGPSFQGVKALDFSS